MPGKRAVEGGTFITPRATYRVNVDSVDPSAQDPSIPILDTRAAPNVSVGLGQGDCAQYGQNGQIDFAVILSGFSSVTLELWLLAEVERRELEYPGASSSSSSSSLPTTEEWVYVEEKAISKSVLWVVKDIPPGQYKVRVGAVTGSGELQIREGHAA